MFLQRTFQESERITKYVNKGISYVCIFKCWYYNNFNFTDDVKILTKTVENQNGAIMSALAELKVVTRKLVRQETSVSAATTGFPISTTDMFKQIEENMNADNIVIYVSKK